MGNLIVYKGDDTSGVLGRRLYFTINVLEGVSLDGCVAKFTVQGITKTWSNITPGMQVELAYTHDETAAMKVGEFYGVFQIVDAQGNIRTFDDSVPFRVTQDIRDLYPGTSSAIVRPAYIVQSVNNTLPDANGNVNVHTIAHPLTEEDIFDMESTDWNFRKALAKVWTVLGGKVINDND